MVRPLITAIVIVSVGLMLTSSGVMAQGMPPQFNKYLFECENSYVLLPASKGDSTYQCHYVYLDRQAGFSMQHAAMVSITPMGTVSRAKDVFDSTKMIVKTRLQSSDRRKVALLSAAMVEQLKLPAEPDWLEFYQQDDPISDAASRAFFYNHIGFSAKALSIMGPLYTPDVSDSNFLFEYVFALNAMNKVDTACVVCTGAVAMHAKNLKIQKEYAYCLMQLKKMDEAVAVYEKIYGLCDSTEQQREYAAESCANISAIKKYQGDEQAAAVWLEKAKAVVPLSSPIAKQILGK